MVATSRHKAGTFVSSHAGEKLAGLTPRPSGGPTSLFCLQPRPRAPTRNPHLLRGGAWFACRVVLVSVPPSSSPSFSSIACLIFHGGLGVGGGLTSGEATAGTHRVPPPFISSYDFSSKTFWGATVHYNVGNEPWLSLPLCVSFVCVEGSQVSSPQKRANRAWPIKGAWDLLGIVRRDGGPAHPAQLAADCR